MFDKDLCTIVFLSSWNHTWRPLEPRNSSRLRARLVFMNPNSCVVALLSNCFWNMHNDSRLAFLDMMWSCFVPLHQWIFVYLDLECFRIVVIIISWGRDDRGTTFNAVLISLNLHNAHGCLYTTCPVRILFGCRRERDISKRSPCSNKWLIFIFLRLVDVTKIIGL